ncbi:hypothetical protein [Sphingobacterium faecium]|nr:hypothetical protein [Sphingobacterium faecium]WGQ15670.1 hypothetical protein QG727_04510 [Sphingobacterium faecium]
MFATRGLTLENLFSFFRKRDCIFQEGTSSSEEGTAQSEEVITDWTILIE